MAELGNIDNYIRMYLDILLVAEGTRSEQFRMFQERCMEMNTELTWDQECEHCNATSPYRTITGCCNNLARKDQGRSNRKLERLMKESYEDGISLPRGGLNPSSLPSPRAISRVVHGAEQTAPKPPVSLILMQFGQFLDHDLSLTPEHG